VSNYWGILCADCGDKHEFCNANHREDFMHAAIRHADAIAALSPLCDEPEMYGGNELKTLCGELNVKWFAAHRGHKLVPVDEYGHRSSDRCPENAVCTCCGARQRCVLAPGHEGTCTAKP
jgi:hypothetical protein